MRNWGWILGGLFVADGIIALVGGPRLLKWSYKKYGKQAPKHLARQLKEAQDLGPAMTGAWGVNNVVAGLGMLALTLLSQRRPARM